MVIDLPAAPNPAALNNGDKPSSKYKLTRVGPSEPAAEPKADSQGEATADEATTGDATADDSAEESAPLAVSESQLLDSIYSAYHEYLETRKAQAAILK